MPACWSEQALDPARGEVDQCRRVAKILFDVLYQRVAVDPLHLQDRKPFRPHSDPLRLEREADSVGKSRRR